MQPLCKFLNIYAGFADVLPFIEWPHSAFTFVCKQPHRAPSSCEVLKSSWLRPFAMPHMNNIVNSRGIFASILVGGIMPLKSLPNGGGDSLPPTGQGISSLHRGSLPNREPSHK